MYEATTIWEFVGVSFGLTLISLGAYILGVASQKKKYLSLYEKNARLKIAVLSFFTSASKLPLEREKVQEKINNVLQLIKEDIHYEKE